MRPGTSKFSNLLVTTKPTFVIRWPLLRAAARRHPLSGDSDRWALLVFSTPLPLVAWADRSRLDQVAPGLETRRSHRALLSGDSDRWTLLVFGTPLPPGSSGRSESARPAEHRVWKPGAAIARCCPATPIAGRCLVFETLLPQQPGPSGVGKTRWHRVWKPGAAGSKWVTLLPLRKTQEAPAAAGGFGIDCLALLSQV